MSLTGWLAHGWRVAHQSSTAEIAELFAVVDRDLEDAVRRKRNQVNYERAGATSAAEAAELHEAVTALRGAVVRWLRKRHQVLCPPGLK